MDCFNNTVLSKDKNTVDGRVIHYMDNMPTDANLTSYEIELLANRNNNKYDGKNWKRKGDSYELTNLSSSCRACKSSIDHIDQDSDIIFQISFEMAMRWYEGPGYYSGIDSVEDLSPTPIEPRNELKEMLEAQAQYFKRDGQYNEFAIDAKGMHKIESERNKYLSSQGHDIDASSLDYDGKDDDGECGASIKALVLICGDQKDPFYYGEHGQCLDFAEVYKKNFGTDYAPPVVYFNQKNFTHPFSSTCDIEVSCGVEETNNLRSVA